jgi:16S rRNA (guanine966-N2)-methyltransferase
VDECRPTPDRVRETLFNWLAPTLVGSRVLDAFAGTGVLGIEALSRGARAVTFVERSSQQAAQIQATLAAFKLVGGTVLCQDAFAVLNRPGEPQDVIFLDPPFALNATALLCKLIVERGWLKPGGLVYVERKKSATPPELPASLTCHRTLTAGTVEASLWRYSVKATA